MSGFVAFSVVAAAIGNALTLDTIVTHRAEANPPLVKQHPKSWDPNFALAQVKSRLCTHTNKLPLRGNSHKTGVRRWGRKGYMLGRSVQGYWGIPFSSSFSFGLCSSPGTSVTCRHLKAFYKKWILNNVATRGVWKEHRLQKGFNPWLTEASIVFWKAKTNQVPFHQLAADQMFSKLVPEITWAAAAAAQSSPSGRGWKMRGQGWAPLLPSWCMPRWR